MKAERRKLRKSETRSAKPESNVESLLAVARGEEPADLILANGRVVNVFTGQTGRANVAIKDGKIAGVGPEYTKGLECYDLADQYILPGFIDGHIHIESSLLSLHEFARLALIHGTTTVVADPHEIANVLGVAGVKYMLKASEGMPLDVLLMAPSCVPATSMETSGACVSAKDTAALLKLDRVIGLAEMMNYPGVAFADKEVLAKLLAAKEMGKPIDGHAPGVVGQLLQAYIAAGVGSDHECVGPHEALEKLGSGMRVMVREGSAARNLTGLLPVVNDFNMRRCCFVTDDKHPEELLRHGYLDATLRKAVSQGLSAAAAVQMVTLNAAECFGLKDRGAVAPGYAADVVVVGDLARFNVRMVLKNGRPVAQDRKLLVKLPVLKDKSVTGTVKIRNLTARSFAIKAQGDLARVIRLVPDQILTEKHTHAVAVQKGLVVVDTERDILKLAVIERHKASGRIGLGLVSGFGLKKGALATTVAHDSHNIIIVGTNDADMLKAAKELKRMGGGLVAIAGGKVAAALALPIAGLMSDRPAEEVAENLTKLLDKAHVWGSRLANPFVTLSFLALPVIPELKLTDRGLVDVSQFKTVSLFE
ncbi:adenine deaminase [candidate division WOR-3 bacterium]|uniref:Adenine deaminase n=1 Tax=candidate division WOR-3 bacterium TaxID=2052148 RepID=A0A938BS12_UNCW3|nr:adenine deaminase [candidate division WOR-3 bacterium]